MLVPAVLCESVCLFLADGAPPAQHDSPGSGLPHVLELSGEMEDPARRDRDTAGLASANDKHC